MNDKDTLIKAIEKAKANGFIGLGKYEVKSRQGYLVDKQKVIEELYIVEYKGVDSQYFREIAVEQVIFDHGFAKALWGEELTYAYYAVDDMSGSLPKWQANLMQMSIVDDRIKYLGGTL